MDSCSCFMPLGKIPSYHFSLATPVAALLQSRKLRFSGSVVLVASATANKLDSSNSTSRNVTDSLVDKDSTANDGTKASAVVKDLDEQSKSISDEMRKEAEDSLEWKSVCTQVAEFCSTSTGRIRCSEGGLPIGKNRGESQTLLDQTRSAVQLPKPLDFSGVDDISAIVTSAVNRSVLSIGDLCAVERSLRAARNVYQQLTNLSSNRYSPLLLLFANCNFLSGLANRIEFCVDCNLSIVKDQASEKLQSIRADRRKNAENLDLHLKNISNRIFQSGGIDSPLITRRRSRMCVGIRASHKSLLPDGIVLGVSSSGATYFMEPREIVDLNNLEVRLSNSEQAEELAILSFLTSDVASSEREIKHLMNIILCVDLASARASHAKWMNSSCPVLSEVNGDEKDDPFSVNIEGFCHPLLLERSLKDSGNPYSSATVVPVDIQIRRGIRVVVISGPNTGGKTATMKSLGLAALMAKSGMFLPAKESPRLPWFDQVLVDIGDSQSLEKNLSTFSGHISRICKILKIASAESLVLVDEIGSGTDPSEGVALATCILQNLLTEAALTLVTTHYADLSLLKLEDGRFENAAMEFSMSTLQPTYRVLWGTTGKSNALTIASAVGFDYRVIDRAREWVEKLLPDKQRERQGLLFQSLSREKDVLEADARKAESLLNQVKGLYHEIHAEAKDLEKREAALKSKESQKLQEEVNAVKSQLDAIVVNFEQQLSRASPDKYAAILRQSDAAISALVNAHTSASDDEEKSVEPSSISLRIGDIVLVNSLGAKSATVVDFVDQGDLVVQYGKMRIRVKRSDVRVSTASSNQEARGEPFSRARSNQADRGEKKVKREEREGEETYGAAVQTTRNTVDLRGMRAEEAGMKVAAAVAACRAYGVLFVVHGVGTGAVKEAALSVLRAHPRVTRFEAESPTGRGKNGFVTESFATSLSPSLSSASSIFLSFSVHRPHPPAAPLLFSFLFPPLQPCEDGGVGEAVQGEGQGAQAPVQEGD